MTRKVLLIGLDGFETSIAGRLIAAGRMPHLQQLLATSARLALEHGPARRTGLAWEHASTGLSPQGAGRWSAVTFDPASYRCWQDTTRLPPFPARCDFDTVVFDVPYFNLAGAPAVQGFVSWGAHDPGVPPGSNPDGLFREVLERFGPYPAKPWIYGFAWPSPARTREMGEALASAAALRSRIARWLLAERLPDWDLGIVVISELHSAIEALWHGIDDEHPLHDIPSAAAARQALEQVYVAVDALIGDLVEAFPDCTHVAFSMHGMGPNSSDVPAMALLPEYLYRRQFGRPHLRSPASLREGVARMCAEETASWTDFVADHWIKANPLLRLARRARRSLRRQPGPRGIPLQWMPATWYADDWPRMPAFALPAFYDGQIRLNVQGREAHGLVPREDYDALCARLVDELNAITDIDTGQPVVREIFVPHPGDPMAVSATEADLIIVWETTSLGFRTQDHGDIGPLPPRRPAGHTGGAGLGLWRGADIAAGDYGECSSFDMVPSLIEYLSGQQAAGIDGHSVVRRFAAQNLK